MNTGTSSRLRSVLLAVAAWCACDRASCAQGVGVGLSLGGYGTTSGTAMAGMGSTSPMVPYAGGFGGFMPYRMASGAGGGLSFSSRVNSVIESSRTPFRMAPMSNGMEAGASPRRGSLDFYRSRGVMGRDVPRLMNRPMGGRDRTDVMPPSFGYPFYQPPSLLSPTTSAAGMSM